MTISQPAPSMVASSPSSRTRSPASTPPARPASKRSGLTPELCAHAFHRLTNINDKTYDSLHRCQVKSRITSSPGLANRPPFSCPSP